VPIACMHVAGALEQSGRRIEGRSNVTSTVIGHHEIGVDRRGAPQTERAVRRDTARDHRFGLVGAADCQHHAGVDVQIPEGASRRMS
jgi:hypothetical protein